MQRTSVLRHSRKKLFTSLGFAAPAILLIGLFIYGFIIWTFVISLTNWDSLAPNYSFAGFRHYVNLFVNDLRFQQDLVNNFTFLPFFVGGTIVIGFILADLLSRNVKLEAFFRTAFLMPMAVSLVVSGTIWVWLYDPTNGPLAAIFAALKLRAINWLGSTSYALPGIIIAAIWQYSGFTTAIYLAGIRGIPQDVIDAARLDGAKGARLYTRIIIPMVQASTVTAFILMVQLSLQMFALIYVMTSGGPALATDMPPVYMFVAAFKQNFIAKGASIAIIIFVFTMAVVVPYLLTAGRITEE
jgi:glucose/mannose transport system permease protein